ncbi:MAG: isoprenylcysteine carboxylmethyltransferase family protein [Proteobacteria bacterium]|nr:isoprenylcysteine carboxylmethyltransferase family protein [Pseudomonadota bacterium]
MAGPTPGHPTAGTPEALPSSAGVVVPAPVWHGLTLAAALGLQTVTTLRLPDWPFVPVLGRALVLAASVASLWAAFELWRAGTTLRPNRPDEVLVARGPYALSRNPIYLSLTLIQLGIAFWTSSVCLVAGALVAHGLVARYCVAREEAYLSLRFGSEYARYVSRVPRWLGRGRVDADGA